MRLTELDPHWLVKDGRRVGMMFRSPRDRDWFQIVTAEPINNRREQWALAHAAAGPDSKSQTACFDTVWQFEGGIENASFDTLTLHPSVDGSSGGLWHGWIRNGEAVPA